MKFCLQCLAVALVSLGIGAQPARAALTPDEVRQTATDAYIYGYPLVDNYRIYYAFAVTGNNTVSKNPASVNSPSPSVFDSPYRIAALDLRSGPIVVTLPPVGKGRFSSLQLIDLYTRDFENLASEIAPSNGGCVLIAGPGWNGPTPTDCIGVLRARSELALVLCQTRLEEPTDLEALNHAFPEFKLETLSSFQGKSPSPPARSIDYLEPLSSAEATANLEFYNELAFLLPFCPPRPDDAASLQQLARLGLVPGRPFGVVFMNAGEKAALTAGMAEGRRVLAAEQPKKSFADVFGAPSFFEADEADPTPPPIFDALSDDGAFEIPFTVDSGGHLLDGSQGPYTLTFDAGRLPPAATAWSLAVYSLPDQQLVQNPIDRYYISSPMLPEMVRGDDGSLTLFIQEDPPGGDHNANWLPAPNGPFLMILRLFGAEAPVLDNDWQRPRVQQVRPNE